MVVQLIGKTSAKLLSILITIVEMKGGDYHAWQSKFSTYFNHGEMKSIVLIP